MRFPRYKKKRDTGENLKPFHHPRRKNSLSQIVGKIQATLQETTTRYIIYPLAIFCIQSVVPDVITSHSIHKKVSQSGFLIVFILGKIIAFLPEVVVVSAGMGLLQ
jgi:hypothetical protein